MKLRQSLNWLLVQYIKTLDDLEYDIRNSENRVGTVRLAGQASVYRKVIEDLTGVLEGEDKDADSD